MSLCRGRASAAHGGGERRRDETTVCVAMEMTGEEGGNKNNTRYDRHWLNEGVSQFWLKFRDDQGKV